MNELRLTGKVFSGKKEGHSFIKLGWVQTQLKQLIGFTPYPGTLNVKLSAEGSRLRKQLKTYASAKIVPEENYCDCVVFKALLNEIECAVVIPKVKGYSDDVVEVVAPVNLRAQLGLEDGDEITVLVQA